MKALSIRQPWAWAILYAGKDIENRSWGPSNPGRLRFRGPFLIHASSGMTRREYNDFVDFYVEPYMEARAAVTLPPFEDIPSFDALPRGGIVGRAELVDVVSWHVSPWFFGPVGLVIANATPLPFRPLKGRLGFFEVDDALAEAA